MNKKSRAYNYTISVLFIAIGVALPFLTENAAKLSLMHIPVLLSGYVLGGKYGLIVGFITPLVRSFMYGMPIMFPEAIAMSFELAIYGIVAGSLYRALPKRRISIIIALVLAMLAGRIVWGGVSLLLWRMQGKTFTFAIFMTSAFINGILGIILHILLIPTIVIGLKKVKIIT